MMSRTRLVAGGLAAATTAAASPVACAHAGERAFVLVLPTGMVIAAGTAAVAASFVLLALLPAGPVVALANWRRRVARLAARPPRWPGYASLAVLAALLAAGHAGSRDPLANPLPAAFWSLWWVGLTFAHALLGNLWGVLQPWSAAHRLLALAPPFRGWRSRPPLALPRRAGCWPAVAAYFAFAWFELIDPAPRDPGRLADAILAYGAVTVAGMALFGERAWLARCEAFTVFFRMVGWLAAPRAARTRGRSGGRTLWLTAPCMRLAAIRLPASGVAFVLLVLSSVSFDGLSRTFWWLARIGVNPLEFPGRSAVVGANSLGLAVTYAVLAVAFVAAVGAGSVLAGPGARTPGAGRLVASLVPIAFGYHFAHYLPAFLVDAQYALRALSDPLGDGSDLLGFSRLHVAASFLTNYASVRVLWYLQVTGIVLAHVAAVLVAHAAALRAAPGDTRAAVRGGAPLAALMVAYTLFGLWLLSAPVAG